MFPIITNIGNFTITSFGVSVVLAFLGSFFIIWRLANIYELDKEKVLDLFIIASIFGVIGARLVYVYEHLSTFQGFSQMLLINRYPGFNFFGGLFLGGLSLLLVSRKFKLSFWQLADLAVVGLSFGLFILSIGCLLGSCQYGYPSKLLFAVNQIGLIDKRFPIQILAALGYLIIFRSLWKKSLKFHFIGKIATVGLLTITIYYFLIGFYRADSMKFLMNLTFNQLYAVCLFSFSVVFFYFLSKRSVLGDIRFVVLAFFNSKIRHRVLVALGETCYTLLTGFSGMLVNIKQTLKKINVKPTPKKF